MKYSCTSILESNGLAGRDFSRGGGRDFCRFGTLFIPYSRENASTQDHISWDDFTQDNLESQHNIVPVERNGLYEKRPGKHFSIQTVWDKKEIFTCMAIFRLTSHPGKHPVPANVSSPLSCINGS